jgi:hypothetical protein
MAAAQDQFDGTAEGLGHGPIKARGQGFKGCGFGAHQIRRG